MPLIAQFVDRISTAATVRLDLNAGPWRVFAKDTSTPPPRLNRASSSTTLADGEVINAASYGNRVINLSLKLGGTLDNDAAEVQKLVRELSRPFNFLRWQVGSQPQWFMTLRSEFDPARWDTVARRVTASILAAPYALGEEQTAGPFAVTHDPATSPPMNANPYFDTSVAGWTGLGGTVVRSTAVFSPGGLLLTPDGVTAAVEARSENVPGVVPGRIYRVPAVVQCAVSRNMSMIIIWRDANGTFLSNTSSGLLPLTANVATAVEVVGAAPVGAAMGQIVVQLAGTPPASNTLHVDFAEFRWAQGGGCFFDLTGVKGDVETPLVIKNDKHLGTIPFESLPNPTTSLWSVRRRGTPANAPFLVQAEAMTPQIDATLLADVTFSPRTSGNTGVRVSFTTRQDHVIRLATAAVPAIPSTDGRGRYRVLARIRKNTPGDTIWASLTWNGVVNKSVVVGQGTRLVDLGDVSIPQGMDPVSIGYGGADAPANGVGLQVHMSRTSGTGTADIDYLLLIPADDSLSLVTYRAYPSLGGFQVFDGPREMVYAVTTGGVIDNGSAKPSTIPGGSGAVLASPGATNRVYLIRDVDTFPEHSLDHALAGGSAPDSQITVSYWPRYLLVRPVTS